MTIKNNGYDREPELREYVDSKIKMLEEDFHITLTVAEECDLRNCKNLRAVDICARGILNQRL